MRLYLDLCCLKRPFDDQSQPRIRVESDAVLALMGVSADRIEFLRAPALDLENDQNSLPTRAARVRQWLESLPLQTIPDGPLTQRTTELLALGFRNFDAFHIASAELCGGEVVASCDDRLIAVARRNAAKLLLRVVNPVELIPEIFP